MEFDLVDVSCVRCLWALRAGSGSWLTRSDNVCCLRAGLILTFLEAFSKIA